MPDPAKSTRLTDAGERGDHRAAADLLPLLYDQLRAIAQERIAGERPDHTLQATALVNEAYLRLVASGTVWTSRGAFFYAAAEAMRRVLVDHARRRGSDKRGGRAARLELPAVLDLAAAPDPAQIMAFDEALLRLEERDPQAAAIVRLRFFAGLSVDETAAALGVSPRSVDRGWAFARAWLWRALGGDEE